MCNDLNHFEECYRTGFKPWDSGAPEPELIRVIEAGKLPGATLMEIGCGTGTNAVELARRGYQVTAVDFVRQAVLAARKKVRIAGVKVDIRVGDVTAMDLGGPYDVLFDRGVYHHLRLENLKGFQQMLKKVTRAGSRWLSLAGNAKEKHHPGPPTVSETEIRAELEPLFEILELREFRFVTNKADFRPPAWSILMQRRK
ncbi:MAG: class I SAM-dependent methyltransferase [Verrucomicrobia bacterium]|nr:class I SAM-dependent methyltransferase [Verrucomicrobiota bacterium]